MDHMKQSGFKIFAVFFVALFLFVVLRNIGLYPSIMADEYLYNLSSRVTPFNQSNIPDYLYYLIYGATNACGDGHLECARVLNAFFFFSATPFIYSIARLVTTQPLALLATACSLIGPVNSYTAYFTPESLYFFGFWAAAWFILNLEPQSRWRDWLTAGIILGLSSLIKPHALLLLPSLLLYFLVLLIRETTLKAMGDSLKRIVLFIAGTLLTKFIGGYWAAGERGLSLLGTTYGSKADKTHEAMELFLNIMFSLKGHFLVLSLLIGLPLSIAIASAVRSTFMTKDRNGPWKVSFFSLMVLLNLLGVVSIFTAFVVDSDFETVTRLHMRYYNFMLPMFFIIAAGALRSIQFELALRWRVTFALVLGAMAIWATLNHMSPYTPTHFDAPELQGLKRNGITFNISTSLLILSFLIWAIDHKRGCQIYFYLALPLWLSLASASITLEQRSRLQQDVYDKAGRFARDYLSAEEKDQLLVVGHDPSFLYRTLYYLDSEKASLRILPEGSALFEKDPYENKGWLLVIGSYQIPANVVTKIAMEQYALYRFTREIAVDFRRSIWPGVLSFAGGLSFPESWGTWSDGKKVQLDFVYPLPKRFRLTLKAHPFSSILGRPVVVRMGESKQTFTLNNLGDTLITLEFFNPSLYRSIQLDIQDARSPESLGINADQRALGLGLVDLTIEALPLD
jgi:phosphoglycerol transferase